MFSYSLEPLHDLLEALVRADRAPVYVVHFTQAAALERAQTLTSAKLCTREERDAIAEAIGGVPLQGRLRQDAVALVRPASASTTPACCRATGGWWSSSRRPAC